MKVQIRSQSHRRRVVGANYHDKVLGRQPIAYWPLDELSGSVAHDWSGHELHGAITGATLGQEGPGGLGAFLFDGANDFVNVYSAALNGLFDGQEGSLMAWVKVYNAGVWDDGVQRRAVRLRVDGSNYLYFRRYEANKFASSYTAGGVAVEGNKSTTTTGWFHVVMVWSKSGDYVKYYWNGGTMAATDTGLGTWSGSLDPNECCIGASNITPVSVWHGWISCVALWDRPLSAGEIADLYVIP